MFVDRVELFVKGGDGGRGMVSFRREKFVPKGGPDGGDGGRGGSVIVRAVANADNLAPLTQKKHWRAKSGEPGSGALCTGSDASDMIIPVPPGTLVRDRDRGNLLKDLVAVGDEVVVGKGGRGGRGNKAFASSTNRTPREHEPGEAGEERWVSLELKVIADAGLIGFPNAGKSTLLSRLSRATPQIADYPFTTKSPNLGIVTLGGDNAFVLADLPGLIEGASQGVGLGHEFLRHVERTRVLVHLVEPFPTDGADPVANYHAIRNELRLYNLALSTKPEVVCVSKAELPGSGEVRDRLAADLGAEVLLISAVTGAGLSQVVGAVSKLIAELRQQEREDAAKPKATEFGTEAVVRTEGEGVTPDVVVDVGNSRVKFGHCRDGVVEHHYAASPGTAGDLEAVARGWFGDRPIRVAVAGVEPTRLGQLVAWANCHGHQTTVVERFDQLPLRVEVDEPARVGIDRLLGALAASRRVEPDDQAVTVDVGTAVTINFVDAGTFRGGCILPGPWLMARALHEFTAKLPLVEPQPGFPVGTVGRNTEGAIRAGIQAAVYGAVERVAGNLADSAGGRLRVFVTGGGHPFLDGLAWSGMVGGVEVDERLVLDGLRIAAEALP